MKNEMGKDKEYVPGGLVMAIGIALVSMCLPFVLSIFGLIGIDEDFPMMLRVVVGLFAGLFLFMGGCLIFGGFVMMVDEAAPKKSKPWLLRAMHTTFRRVFTPRCLLAALFPALAATIYITVYRNGQPLVGMDEEFLRRAIFIEFLAIHATGFLGAASLMPVAKKGIYIKFGVFALLSLLYLLIGHLQGWAVFLMLGSLVFFKFGPLVFQSTSADFKMELGVRWVVQMMLLASCYSCLGDHSSDTDEILDVVTLEIGLVYWSLVALVELLGIPQSHNNTPWQSRG